MFYGRAVSARGHQHGRNFGTARPHGCLPEEIACCGQPPFNSGYWDEARPIAGKVLEKLKDAEAIVIGSGSCGAMVKKFYPELFANTPQAEPAETNCRAHLGIFRISRQETWRDRSRREISAPVTFHDGCHGLRELGSKIPRALLGNVRAWNWSRCRRPRLAAVSVARSPRSFR